MSRTSFRVNPHSIVCLNVKELFTWSRRHIWSLSDSNEIQTHNHLVRKWTLNHLAKLAKWLSCVVSTYLYDAFDCMLSSCHARVSEWIHTYSSPEYLQFKWQQRDSSPQPLTLLTTTQPFSQTGQICYLLRARNSLTFRQTIASGFTLKLVREMIATYSRMHRTNKYSKHSSIIWPVCLNGWVFVYKLSGCRLESRCCHFRIFVEPPIRFRLSYVQWM